MCLLIIWHRDDYHFVTLEIGRPGPKEIIQRLRLLWPLHLYAAVLCAKGAGRERESKEQLELAVKAHPMRNYASLTALRLLGQERNVPETAEGRSERLRRGSAAGKELLV